jgi:hypothetical protein
VGFGPGDAEVAVVGINPAVRAADGVKGAFVIPYLAVFQRYGKVPPKLQGAERAFWELARLSGLDLSAVYSTNALKCATPGNRGPTPAEVDACARTHLTLEMTSLTSLRIILVLGRAAGAHLGLSSFGAKRRVDGTLAEAVLLRHPVATLRRWTAREAEAARWRAALSGRALRS